MSCYCSNVRLCPPVSVMHLSFFFFCHRQIKPITNKNQKCTTTIDYTSPDVVEEFRSQEAERYKLLGKAFTYNVGGIKAVVAPLRRGEDPAPLPLFLLFLFLLPFLCF